MQVIYTKKHLAPTEVEYVGFNSNKFKDDKVFGGGINFILVVSLIISSFATNWTLWFYDQHPYMSSLQIPFTTDGL